MDSPERAQNLDLVVEQLMALKDSIRMEIRILEADEHPHYELKISDEHIHKTFVRDASPVFHRTKYLNRLMQEAEGAIVGIWDTDVLLPKEQILEAVDAIRKGNAVMSFPYDGRFYMLPQEDSLLLKKREMNMEECCQKINISMAGDRRMRNVASVWRYLVYPSIGLKDHSCICFIPECRTLGLVIRGWSMQTGWNLSEWQE